MHGRLGRRRRQRPLAAVLRQLLRAARLRVRARPDARHRLHDGGLPEPRRPGGHRRREVDRRLAQRPRPRVRGARRHVTEGGRRLAQRQLGDDRQVLRRHAVQRRGGDRRRRPEDDRPDLGDLRLVPLLAHRRRAAQQRLPGRPQHGDHDGRQPAPGRRPAQPAAAVREGAQRVCAPDRRRLARRRQRVLVGPRLRQGRAQDRRRGVRRARLPGRQRPHEPPRALVGRAEEEPRAAQAVADAHRAHRPVRGAPREVGRDAAPLVRPLPARRPQRHPVRAAGHGRGRDGRLERVPRLAGPGHLDGRRVPAGRQ